MNSGAPLSPDIPRALPGRHQLLGLHGVVLEHEQGQSREGAVGILAQRLPRQDPHTTLNGAQMWQRKTHVLVGSTVSWVSRRSGQPPPQARQEPGATGTAPNWLAPNWRDARRGQGRSRLKYSPLSIEKSKPPTSCKENVG